MMDSARISSTWGKVPGKDACSRYRCSACFSRRYCVWRRNASSRMRPSRTTWCRSNEKAKGETNGTTRTEKVDGRREKEREKVQILCGLLYADDAGIVSRSSKGLEKMMTVIVTACSPFEITISGAKTEILCLQTKGGVKVSFTSMQSAWYTNKHRVCVLGRGHHRRQRP